MYLSRIIREVKENITDIFTNDFNIKIIVKELSESRTLKNRHESTTTFIIPIYYLFYHVLNEDIGSLHLTMYNIIRKLNLDELMEISEEYTYIGISSHSTILYKFINDGRKYIYYSNSGLGINQYQLYYKFYMQ